MTPIGRKIGQGQQDEGPLVHARMRDFRAACGRQDLVVIGDKVQIDNPRAPALPSHAPKSRLDPMQGAQQGTWRQVGRHGGHAIDEPGLARTRQYCSAAGISDQTNVK